MQSSIKAMLDTVVQTQEHNMKKKLRETDVFKLQKVNIYVVRRNETHRRHLKPRDLFS